MQFSFALKKLLTVYLFSNTLRQNNLRLALVLIMLVSMATALNLRKKYHRFHDTEDDEVTNALAVVYKSFLIKKLS